MRSIFLILLLNSTILSATDTIYTSIGSLIKYDHFGANVYSINESPNGDIWVGTQNGVWRLIKNNWIHYTESNGLSDNYVNTIFIEDTNKIWVGTNIKNGLNLFNGSYWTYFTSTSSIPNYVYSICKGIDGSYYISGRDKSGNDDVFKYDGTNFTQFYLSGSWFNHIERGKDNKIYLSTYSNLYTFDYSTWNSYFSGYSTLYNKVETSDNKWLINSSLGFFEFNGTTFQKYTYSNTMGGLLDDGNYAIIEYRPDTFWIGTKNGICSFDGTHWESIELINSRLNSLYIESMFKDGAGNIWIGDRNGNLYKFNPNDIYGDRVNSNLISGKSYCSGNSMELKVNVKSFYNQDNYFIVQLSNLNGNFSNPVNLYSINTSLDVNISIPEPSNIIYGNKYLIRVISTSPELSGQTDTIIFFQNPTSTFTTNKSKLCGTDTVSISYTGTGTSNASYNWNFNSGNIISGTGQGDYQINWAISGLKNISLSVEENGCTSTFSSQNVTVYQPNSSFLLDNVVCYNQNTIIEFNGVASDSALFNWDFGDANIVYESNESYIVNWNYQGVKNISLIVNDNGCFSSKTIQSIEHIHIPTPSLKAPEKVCFNGVAKIEFIGTASDSMSYIWNFDNGSIISGNDEGPYDVTWSYDGMKTIYLIVAENSCSVETSINLIVNQQTSPISICMVGVDSSNQNMIIWEQPVDNPYDSILVYKETSQSDLYNKIGSQSANKTSVFIDNNSNPNQNSSRYKISVLDTCGSETPQSEYHKTIHLTINSGINGSWNLIWDGYEGINFSTYYIYRGTSENNLIKIAEQASNTFTYTDLTPPQGTVYYQLEIANTNSCNINNLKSSNDYFSYTRSNIVNSNQINPIYYLSLDDIVIYPNPAVDKLFVKSIYFTNYNIEILSLEGKLHFKNQIITDITELDISNLNPGFYLIRMTNDKKSMNMKLIKR